MAKQKENGQEQPKAAAKDPTCYVVLQRLAPVEGPGPSEAWFPIGSATGHTKPEAIKTVTKLPAPNSDGEEYRAGTFRAVPARSWPDDADLVIENQRRVLPVFSTPKEAGPVVEAERVPATA